MQKCTLTRSNQQIISRLTLVQYVSDVRLSDFISELGKQRVQEQGTVGVGLTVHCVSLHHHLRPMSTFSHVLEQLSHAEITITGKCFHITTTTTTVLQPFFRDHPGQPVPEENFWTLW